MALWKEIVIYVHGITPEEEITSHKDLYLNFHHRVKRECEKRKKGDWPDNPVMVEWGWSGSLGEDKFLAEVERKIASFAFAELSKCRDFTLNPLRLGIGKVRQMFLYGVADIFYYVSEDGKRVLRKNIFSSLLTQIKRDYLENKKLGLSLTCIGHSAGTVILNDFLYHIFSAAYRTISIPVYRDLRKSEKDTLITLRKMAEAGELRLRKFYTFGSPLTPLIFRSQNLINRAYRSKEGFLSIKEIGILPYSDLKPPRWLNFYDKDDIIGYPVAFLYHDNKGEIKDICIDVSDRVSKAHSRYWYSRKIVCYIADNF